MPGFEEKEMMNKKAINSKSIAPHIPLCIICRKPFDASSVIPSLEHIIPEALGNEKITTICVCETCNNQLGTRVDSYLTDHIFTKFIRQQKLEKDRDIQLFSSTLPEKDTDKKFRVFNEHAESITQILEAEDLENDGLHLRIDAKSMEDGLAKAKVKIKRMRPEWTDEEIQKILSRDGAVKRGDTEYVQPILQQEADIDKTRWMLAAIKMAYEFACEKIGEAYLDDEIALKFSNWLNEGVKGKKEYTDEEFVEISKYCNVFDPKVLKILQERIMIGGFSKAKHVFALYADMEGKMISTIRVLDEDILTFTVLVSMEAGRYLKDKGIYISIILEDGEKVEF